MSYLLTLGEKINVIFNKTLFFEAIFLQLCIALTDY